MKITNNYTDSYFFTGRCVQIKDAQWVCHTVHTTLPHISTTKFKPAFTKLYFKNFPEQKNTTFPQTIYQLKLLMDNVNLLTKDEYSKLNPVEKLKFKLKRILSSKESKKDLKILTKCKELILNMGKYRNQYENSKISQLKKTLTLLEQYKIGNCQEDAILAELILKMNGMKNATYATLLNESTRKQIDHAVCIVNKDGSKFNGKITNKTIIIDPWAWKADFAKNMIPFYKNTMNEYFDINSNTAITFLPVETVYLTDDAINTLRKKYNSFIYKNKTRKFMQS